MPALTGSAASRGSTSQAQLRDQLAPTFSPHVAKIHLITSLQLP
jgi:hypothetical protein